MRNIILTITDEDLARVLEAIESDSATKMETVGRSPDMYTRGAVHTHCEHLKRIAGDFRVKLA